MGSECLSGLLVIGEMGGERKEDFESVDPVARKGLRTDTGLAPWSDLRKEEGVFSKMAFFTAKGLVGLVLALLVVLGGGGTLLVAV